MDRVLLHRGTARTLADRKAVRASRELQDLGRYERVVEDEIRFGQTACGLQREQLGIAWTRADEGDEAGHDATSVAAMPLSAYRRLSPRRRSGRRSPIGTPAARCSCRNRWAASTHVSTSSGTSASSPSRRSPASAGARPSVETAMVTPPLRNTPPA